MNDCPFCTPEILRGRTFYEDAYCFATLSREPYTWGHSLVILRAHAEDITADIPEVALAAFTSAIHKVSRRLKERLRNEAGQAPERIYVSTLCDGVHHLHAHLIPRYPYDAEDFAAYREIFAPRDGEEAVGKAIANRDIGGFWYIARREATFKSSSFQQSPEETRSAQLAALARELA